MLDLIRDLLALNLSRYLSVIDRAYNLRNGHVHYRVDLWGFNSARGTRAQHGLWPSGLSLGLSIELRLQLLWIHAVMQVHNRVPSIRSRHTVYVLKDQGHGRLFEPGLSLEIEVHLREDLVHSLILRAPY